MKLMRYIPLLAVALQINAFAKDIWIVNNGTPPGLGTTANPYVAINPSDLPNILSSNPGANTFHLGPGVFRTDRQIYPMANCTYQGAIDAINHNHLLTTIRAEMNLNQNGQFSVIGVHNFTRNNRADNVTVQNLIIDCGADYVISTGYRDFVMQAVHLQGSSTTIRNVRAINWGGAGDYESFVLVVDNAGDDPNPVCGCTIDGCEVTAPATGFTWANGVTCIAFNGAGGSGASAGTGSIYNGTIENCYVHDINGPHYPNSPTYVGAIGTAGTFSSGVYNNTILNLPDGGGSHQSVLSSVGLNISGNTISNVMIGIQFQRYDTGAPGGVQDSICIDNNTITAHYGDWNSSFCIMFQGYNDKPLTNISISNNNIYNLNTYFETDGILGDCSNGIGIYGNKFNMSNNPRNQIYLDQNGVSNVTVTNNTDYNNNVVGITWFWN